jgi:hypothetical protein
MQIYNPYSHAHEHSITLIYVQVRLLPIFTHNSNHFRDRVIFMFMK